MITAILVAALVSAVTCAVFVHTRAGHALLDRPNRRSLHQHPVPRVGGVAIFLGVATGATWMFMSGHAGVEEAVVATASLPLVLVGALDDRYSLRASTRFLAQAATVITCLFSTDWVLRELAIGSRVLPLGLLAWPLTTVAVLWGANLYNFMDGSDGLAATMTVVGFGTLGAFAAAGQHRDIMIVAALPAAAAVGFLIFNRPRARLFMGDSGSVPLGFLAAAIALWGVRRGAWPAVVPPIVFAPFVVDATVTLIDRARRGQRVWEAHRDHAYQRLILRGWSHAKLLVAETVFMAISSFSAALAWGAPGWGTAVAITSVIGVYGALSYLARRGTARPSV